ncbi:hypothetical protein KSS87_017330, partial [Heliosperma pusillum]
MVTPKINRNDLARSSSQSLVVDELGSLHDSSKESRDDS